MAPCRHDSRLRPSRPVAHDGAGRPARPIPGAGTDLDDIGAGRRRRIHASVRLAGCCGDDLAAAVLGRRAAAARRASTSRQACPARPRSRRRAGRDQRADDPGVLRRGQPAAAGHCCGGGIPRPTRDRGTAQPPAGPGVGGRGVARRGGPHPTLVPVAERPRRAAAGRGRRHRLGAIATTVALFLLHQVPDSVQLVGVLLVVAASVGAERTALSSGADNHNRQGPDPDPQQQAADPRTRTEVRS